MRKREYMRLRRVGPGGWYCPCCAPAKRERKAYLRAVKRGVEKTLVQQEIVSQLTKEDENG